jgi:hypothetical protein
MCRFETTHAENTYSLQGVGAVKTLAREIAQAYNFA